MSKHRFTKETTERKIKTLKTRDKNIVFKSNINKEIFINRINKYKMVGYQIDTDMWSGTTIVVKDKDILILSSEQILFDGADIFSGLKANKIVFEGNEFQELTDSTAMFSKCELGELILKDMTMPKLYKASKMFSDAVIGVLQVENLDLPKLRAMDYFCAGLNSMRVTIKNLNMPMLDVTQGTYESFRSMQIGSKFIIEGIDTSKLKSISFMFFNSVIPELDLSKLDFSSVTGAVNAFGETDIDVLNLGNVDFRNLKYADEMFCNALIKSDIVIKSELPGLERAIRMFNKTCTNKIDISTLKPLKEMLLMEEMFDSCKAKEININKEMLATIKKYKKQMTNNCRAKLVVV